MPSLRQLNSATTMVAWPEPVQRVQLLAGEESPDRLRRIPSRYVRPVGEQPGSTIMGGTVDDMQGQSELLSVPVVQLSDLEEPSLRQRCLEEIRRGCEQWGFFQVVSHGIPASVLEGAKGAARGWFEGTPACQKEAFANDPLTYEGYGSRLGVQRGATLDWGDYFFLNLLPRSHRNPAKWPATWRPGMDLYARHVSRLCGRLLQALSVNLGLERNVTAGDAGVKGGCPLEEAFGIHDESTDMGLRVNYYPVCPQPQLTLGLSPHSDPGGLTVLLQDDEVPGLQVKHRGQWLTVQPIPGALVVNVGDQIEILTNGAYKSVEHRVLVNNFAARLSLACFFNPANDTIVAPLPSLLADSRAIPLYQGMTFREYRSLLRNQGNKGKAHLASVASPTSLSPLRALV